MPQSLTRRVALKLFGLTTSCLACFQRLFAHPNDKETARTSFMSSWDRTHDRVWIGQAYWANPMEDWRIHNGGLECTSRGGGRNLHILTRQLDPHKGGFEMSVGIQRLEKGVRDGGAGFRIGVRSELDEVKSNVFSRNGLPCGLIDGNLVLGERRERFEQAGSLNAYTLALKGEKLGNRRTLLKLRLLNRKEEELVSIQEEVDSASVKGNVALVHNFDHRIGKDQGARYRFTRWQIAGDGVDVSENQAFGPILWSMYSLSDSRSAEGFVLKLSALTGPLGGEDSKAVELHLSKGGEWIKKATEKLDEDAWTATFRIPHWEEKSDRSYKLVYRERLRDGSIIVHERRGIVKANPEGRPLRVAALTCQKDYGFPYQPVVDNLERLDPDLLYFSGDQLYEDHGGFGLIRDPAEAAILNYLRKFYLFGWAFGGVMRDRPTLCIPDDHDVFQGNIWGEGGAKMEGTDTSSRGGYREPARMVNAVHKTCAGHHPDYFDPSPVKQGISVYYGDMVYGGVGFAVIADRQFKTGPEKVDTGSGRADHVSDPGFDTRKLDQPGLVLLGDRQEAFLARWVKDWRGHQMKVLLSQTVFAGVATHHGKHDGYLKADLDSGGWPQSARNRAIAVLREGMPLHINGDQHLTSLSQYGVDRQRDSFWSFCVPAIAAGYPRWWRPDELGMPHENRPDHGLENTGEYLDGFGNRIYVYAVGNPEVGKLKNRYELAHQKGSGFGLVTVDGEAQTYTVESYRFLVDATDGNPMNQFPGWPVVIHQEENGGKNRIR